MAFSTQQIAQYVEGDLKGPPDIAIHAVQEMSAAGPSDLTFIGDDKYAAAWTKSAAAAALVTRDLNVPHHDGKALIFVDNADLAMARVLALFAPPPPHAPPTVHPAAVVDPTAKLGKNVSIGAGCYVGPNALIGDNVVLYANVTVMDDSRIGNDSILWPGVVIRERCALGERCILHPNVTIGADGFGYRPSADGKGLTKIPQIGTVEIGNDVEIGAATCVDRGKFAATTIADGVKIDNLVQIAHNCRIGRCCVIAAHCAIAGSVTIGDGVMMGGQVAVADHITIGPGVRIYGCAAVITDVPAGQTWAGVPARDRTDALREYAAIRKLPELVRKAKRR